MESNDQTMSERDSIYSALDFGSSKVMCAIARVSGSHELEILGMGHARQSENAVKEGQICDFDRTVDSVLNAVEEAEKSAAHRVGNAWVNISGMHVRSINKEGGTAIRKGEVRETDVHAALTTAGAVRKASKQTLLHVLPQEFVIDERGGINFPTGLSGERLDVKVHLIAANRNPLNDLASCLRRCGIRHIDFVFSPLAIAQAVLHADEMHLGTLLIDIGSGISEVAYFYEGAIWRTFVSPIAGEVITRDIAQSLRTSFVEAETIKKQWAHAYQGRTDDSPIEFKRMDSGTNSAISRNTLSNIVEARYKEQFDNIAKTLSNGGILDERELQFVVLTGGGALTEDLTDLASEIFQTEARIGTPRDVELDVAMHSTRCTTVIGLIRYAHNFENSVNYADWMDPTSVFAKIRYWLRGNI